jgi:hypothetical protein
METMAEEAAARPRASREALRALTAKLLMAVHLAQTISEEVKLYQSSGPVRFDVVVATSSVRVQTASESQQPAAALGYCPCRGG